MSLYECKCDQMIALFNYQILEKVKETIPERELPLLSIALSAYFHNEMEWETAFNFVDKKEKEYVQKIDSIYAKYEPSFDADVYGYMNCTSSKAKVCDVLLSEGKNIYDYYPEKDARGEFEVDYDAVKLWEQIRFGKVVDSQFVGSYEFCTYEIDKEQADYKEYREKLYSGTIDKVCEKYTAFIYAELDDKQKELVRSYLNGDKKVCEQNSGYFCPDGSDHINCNGCCLAESMDNCYPEDDC